jgi:hypothetical protein
MCSHDEYPQDTLLFSPLQDSKSNLDHLSTHTTRAGVSLNTSSEDEKFRPLSTQITADQLSQNLFTINNKKFPDILVENVIGFLCFLKQKIAPLPDGRQLLMLSVGTLTYLEPQLRLLN